LLHHATIQENTLYCKSLFDQKSKLIRFIPDQMGHHHSSIVNSENYLPGISIDCVIFGYHQKKLKVLILEYKGTNLYALPGGFVRKDENLDKAAGRILLERTGLSNIYLNQFHTFGNLERNNPKPMKQVMKKIGSPCPTTTGY